MPAHGVSMLQNRELVHAKEPMIDNNDQACEDFPMIAEVDATT